MRRTECVVARLAIDLLATVGTKQLTNRNLKQIITINCMKTVIFQVLKPLDISKLIERAIIWLEIITKRYDELCHEFLETHCH